MWNSFLWIKCKMQDESYQRDIALYGVQQRIKPNTRTDVSWEIFLFIKKYFYLSRNISFLRNISFSSRNCSSFRIDLGSLYYTWLYFGFRVLYQSYTVCYCSTVYCRLIFQVVFVILSMLAQQPCSVNMISRFVIKVREAHSSTFIPFQPLLSTLIYFHPHLSTLIHFNPHLSTLIHFHPHLSTFIHFYTHSFIFTHFH